MAKYFVFNIPQQGNVNPTLAVVQELVAQGNEVVYYLSEEYRHVVEATGAKFRSYASSISSFIGRTGGAGSMISANSPQLRSRLIEAFSNVILSDCETVIDLVLNDVREEHERPDVILYGQASVWGRMLAQMWQVPAILMRPTYASNEHFQLFNWSQSQGQLQEMDEAEKKKLAEVMERYRARAQALSEKYHIPPLDVHSIMLYTEPLTLVFVPRAFQIAGDTFDERHKFVGPGILPRPDESGFPLERLAASDQRTLFISLGTSFNDRPDFYNLCFKAFKDSSWQVVQSIGKRVDRTLLDPIPANFLVYPYVPQLEVLKHTDVFVTHGGMNSTMEALSQGIPLVVVPQMREQDITARRVQELGIGIRLDMQEVSAEVLREAVDKVSNDPAYRENARRMQRIIQESGGYKAAAATIISYTQERMGGQKQEVKI